MYGSALYKGCCYISSFLSNVGCQDLNTKAQCLTSYFWDLGKFPMVFSLDFQASKGIKLGKNHVKSGNLMSPVNMLKENF